MSQDADLIEKAPLKLEKAAETFTRVRRRISDVIFGQDDVVEQTLATLMAGGHGLLIGVPGLAKTKLVDSLGAGAGKVDFIGHQQLRENRSANETEAARARGAFLHHFATGDVGGH